MLVTTKLTRESINTEPFPWAVIPNALEAGLYQSLLDGLPSLDDMTKGITYGSNERLNYSPTNIAYNPRIPDVWRTFASAHLSDEFLNSLTQAFQEQIRIFYPELESRFGKVGTLKSGIRNADEHSSASVLMDFQIGVNTPVEFPGTTVRGPHVDDPRKLFIGLFYMRLPGDTSTGGELEIYRAKGAKLRMDVTRTVNPNDVETVARVPYEGNTLVLLLNTRDSLHGVTPRSRTGSHRVFVNLLAQMREPLFAPEVTVERPTKHPQLTFGQFATRQHIAPDAY